MTYYSSPPLRPVRLRLTGVRLLLLLLAAIALGCSGVVDADADSPGTLDGSDDPTLATIQIPGVVVGFVGNGMVVQNHSNMLLKSVVIVVNEGGANGGFRFRTREVGANSTNTYLTQVFRNPEGQSLDPDTVKIEKFALYADTPDGRGYWRGAY